LIWRISAVIWAVTLILTTRWELHDLI